MHLRIVDESIYSLVAGLRQIMQINGVGLHLSHGRDARLRAGDTQLFGKNALPLQLIAGGQCPGESDLDRHYLFREARQVQPQL